MSVRTTISAGYGCQISLDELKALLGDWHDDDLSDAESERRDVFRQSIADLSPNRYASEGDNGPVVLVGDGPDGWISPMAIATESLAYYVDYPMVYEGFPKFISTDDDRVKGWQETLRQFAKELNIAEPTEFGICISADLG